LVVKGPQAASGFEGRVANPQRTRAGLNVSSRGIVPAPRSAAVRTRNRSRVRGAQSQRPPKPVRHQAQAISLHLGDVGFRPNSVSSLGPPSRSQGFMRSDATVSECPLASSGCNRRRGPDFDWRDKYPSVVTLRRPKVSVPERTWLLGAVTSTRPCHDRISSRADIIQRFLSRAACVHGPASDAGGRRRARDEFDLQAEVWTIPTVRMKARVGHRVPR
jgi:hypothetical protein